MSGTPEALTVWRRAAGLIGLALCSTVLVVGCASDRSIRQESPQTRPKSPSVVGSAAVTLPKAAKPSEPLKVGFLYVGPVGDAGWTFAHDKGRKALERHFGQQISTTYVENVPESADAERVMRDMVGQGNRLIFATTFGYMEPMRKVAADARGVKFEHALGYKVAENMRTYDCRTYEGAYMAGVIAGKMTKTGTLGVVASIPIPEIIRDINSFTLGAQSSNPQIKTKVVWVNEWFNPRKEAEAANSLINSGADVLIQNTDSTAVVKTAQDRGKRAIGWDSDMSAFAPKAHLASSIVDWAPYYIKATADALNGTWATGQSWWGVREGSIDIVSIADDVPADTRARVDAIKAGLKDGSFVIWRGLILDNMGNVRVPKGMSVDDRVLAGMNFFVKGVEGKIPGSP